MKKLQTKIKEIFTILAKIINGRAKKPPNEKNRKKDDETFSVLRGCLSKTHRLNLFQKIFFPETLATERLYQG